MAQYSELMGEHLAQIMTARKQFVNWQHSRTCIRITVVF
jgi:hypothetical protein